MKILTGHTSQATAYKVDDYPYGFRKRTSIFYWIETEPKKGDRFCSMTLNPDTGKPNKPKKSTYCNIGYMFLNDDNHVKWTGVSIYSDRANVIMFGRLLGLENLNAEQRKQYNSLLGIREATVDEMTGAVKKDFSVKWEKFSGKIREVRITFDRPDGVSLKEIFKAMASLNQDKLNQVFEIEHGTFGSSAGTVRICVRGGTMLGTVTEDQYKNWLAMDENANVIGQVKIK